MGTDCLGLGLVCAGVARCPMPNPTSSAGRLQHCATTNSMVRVKSETQGFCCQSPEASHLGGENNGEPARYHSYVGTGPHVVRTICQRCRFDIDCSFMRLSHRICFPRLERTAGTVTRKVNVAEGNAHVGKVWQGVRKYCSVYCLWLVKCYFVGRREGGGFHPRTGRLCRAPDNSKKRNVFQNLGGGKSASHSKPRAVFPTSRTPPRNPCHVTTNPGR